MAEPIKVVLQHNCSPRTKITIRTYPSDPRLLPDASGWVCDQCGQEWVSGQKPDCQPCDEAWAKIDAAKGQ